MIYWSIRFPWNQRLFTCCITSPSAACPDISISGMTMHPQVLGSGGWFSILGIVLGFLCFLCSLSPVSLLPVLIWRTVLVSLSLFYFRVPSPWSSVSVSHLPLASLSLVFFSSFKLLVFKRCTTDSETAIMFASLYSPCTVSSAFYFVVSHIHIFKSHQL